MSRRNKSCDHLNKCSSELDHSKSFDNISLTIKKEKTGILGNLMNNKNIKRSKINQLESKIFWNRNNLSPQTIEKIKQKNQEEKSHKNNKSIDIFKKDQLKYQKIYKATANASILSLPAIKENIPPLQCIQNLALRKSLENEKVRSNKKKNMTYKNFLELSPAEQSCIMQERYISRCRDEADKFNFSFNINQEPKKQKLKKNFKKTHFRSAHQQAFDSSVPIKFLPLYYLQKLH